MARRNKKKMILWSIGALLLLLGAMAWLMRPPKNSIPTAARGTLERFPQFTSQYVPSRDVVVWLPEGYQIGDSCDVLYMHDGNMLFDATTTWNRREWQVDEVTDSLIQAGLIRPCIVVGIYNTDDRLAEYFPAKTWQHVAETDRKDADLKKLTADAYLQFIVEELKPFIDQRYKPLTTREHTFMMGSSMGGLISLYALCECPQVFGGVACLSSHLSMAHLPNGVDGEPWATGFRNYVGQHLPEVNGSLIYMDHGTEGFDADYGQYQEQLDSVIRAKGWDAQHYMSLVFDGDDHNETCWGKRINQPLQFLLSK
jgi:enterochelin esterase-like enzyme